MSSSGLGGCCPWRVTKRLLGLDFDDYEILNGMMTLRHDDIMTLRPDCMMPCKSMSRWWAVCGSNAGRSRGGILFFFGKLQRILFKSPPPSRRILTKVFTKTFTKLSLTFTKLSPKGPKRGKKVDFFPQNFLQLSPDPQKFVGHERFPYLCTVS